MFYYFENRNNSFKNEEMKDLSILFNNHTSVKFVRLSFSNTFIDVYDDGKTKIIRKHAYLMYNLKWS